MDPNSIGMARWLQRHRHQVDECILLFRAGLVDALARAHPSKGLLLDLQHLDADLEHFIYRHSSSRLRTRPRGPDASWGT